MRRAVKNMESGITFIIGITALAETLNASEPRGTSAHGQSPPILYWFNWLLLLIAIGVLIMYLLKSGKGIKAKKTYHSIGFAVTLGLLTTMIVTISLLPSVGHYHESPPVGFTRFILMITMGFLLIAYGFREHEVHKHASHSTKGD